MNLKIKAAILAAAGALAVLVPAKAQVGTTGLYPKTSQPWFQQGKVSGGLAVTSSSARVILPTSGFQAWVCNIGSVDAFVAFGGSTIAATATGSSLLKAGACGTYDLFPTTAKFTYIAAITASSSTTLAIETGAGNGPTSSGAAVSATISGFPTGFVTTSGAVQPATAASGKITTTYTSVAATTNTTIAAANANRIAVSVQCDGTAPVAVSEKGSTLSSVTDANASIVFPAGSFPTYIPPIATLTAITAYTGTTQNCRVAEYSR